MILIYVSRYQSFHFNHRKHIQILSPRVFATLLDRMRPTLHVQHLSKGYPDTKMVTSLPKYIASLRSSKWVKIINGAANQDLPLIRNICYLYTLCGVDCLDLSPDLSVLIAAHSGIKDAMNTMSSSVVENPLHEPPIVMVSITDGEDLHFRKASFDPNLCPIECPRPCERVCPVSAIPPLSAVVSKQDSSEGVITSKCYGCGRCVAVCPRGLILTNQFKFSLDQIEGLLKGKAGEKLVEAVEIHTTASSGHIGSSECIKRFKHLWSRIGETVLQNVKVLSISLQDSQKSKDGSSTEALTFIRQLYLLITSHPAWKTFQGVLIWQADGRPMSGDIGKGATHATIQFAEKILKDATTLFTQNNLSDTTIDEDKTQSYSPNNVFIQLAGGTNQYTLPLAKEEIITHTNCNYFGGVAFGGYARKTIAKLTHHLAQENPAFHIENFPEELEQCLEFVRSLISTVKGGVLLTS